MSAPVREKIAVFGETRGLVGILSLPTDGAARGVPHVVLLNSGIIHRVGSNRLSVELARALGAAGVTTLRFDLSGIGDSERRPGVASLRASVERDITEAMDYLVETTGSQTFVLMGACSGAYDALHAARSDERVVGALMVDLAGPFQGWRHSVYHIGKRLFRTSSWQFPLKKLAYHARAIVASGSPSRNGQYVPGGRSSASRLWMEEHFSALLGRDVRLFFVFTAGLEQNYNHRSQFRAAFPRAARHPALKWEYFTRADHIFSRQADRDELVALAVRWMSTEPFPNRTPAVRNGVQP